MTGRWLGLEATPGPRDRLPNNQRITLKSWQARDGRRGGSEKESAVRPDHSRALDAE